MMRARPLLLALLLGSGCLVWDAVDARTTAGSVLSKPIVHAKLLRHEERVIAWGTSTTHTLEVTIGDQRCITPLSAGGSDVRISPNRKTVAVESSGQWRFFAIRSDINGTLSLVRDDEELDALAWTPSEATPPPTDWWLVGLAVGSSAAALAAAVLIRRVRARRRQASP